MRSRLGLCLLGSFLALASCPVFLHYGSQATAQQSDATAPSDDPFADDLPATDPFAQKPSAEDPFKAPPGDAEDPFGNAPPPAAAPVVEARNDAPPASEASTAAPQQEQLPARRDLKAATPVELRKWGMDDYVNGNYSDCYDALHEWICRPREAGEKIDHVEVANYFRQACECLKRLGRTAEFEAFCEAAVAARPNNWRLLWAAAEWYTLVPHQGRMVGGRFLRNNSESASQVVNAARRDRARAIQLMHQAMGVMPKDTDGWDKRAFYEQLADFLVNKEGVEGIAWLMGCTQLSGLPGYDPGWNPIKPRPVLPAVDGTGEPALFATVTDFASARSDGERWQWALSRAEVAYPEGAEKRTSRTAAELHELFGVQTLLNAPARVADEVAPGERRPRQGDARPAHARRGGDDRPAGRRHPPLHACRRR